MSIVYKTGGGRTMSQLIDLLVRNNCPVAVYKNSLVNMAVETFIRERNRQYRKETAWYRRMPDRQRLEMISVLVTFSLLLVGCYRLVESSGNVWIIITVLGMLALLGVFILVNISWLLADIKDGRGVFHANVISLSSAHDFEKFHLEKLGTPREIGSPLRILVESTTGVIVQACVLRRGEKPMMLIAVRVLTDTEEAWCWVHPSEVSPYVERPAD